MDWKQLLASVTGSVNQELLLRNEYLVTENRMLRQQIRGHVRLSDSDRKTLAAIGKKLGKQALEEVSTIAKPDTILAWHRKLVAQKFDGFQQRKPPGAPRSTQTCCPPSVMMGLLGSRHTMAPFSRCCIDVWVGRWVQDLTPPRPWLPRRCLMAVRASSMSRTWPLLMREPP